MESIFGVGKPGFDMLGDGIQSVVIRLQLAYTEVIDAWLTKTLERLVIRGWVHV